MSLPKTLLAYSDCISYFDSALQYSVGVRLPVSDLGAAYNLRMRLNNARKLDRENNARMYPPGHPMHGVSQYDKITARIKSEEGQHYLYLERNDVESITPEGLGEPLAVEEDEVDGLEYTPIKSLPAPSPDLALDELEVGPEPDQFKRRI
jgi:hypothetical protein